MNKWAIRERLQIMQLFRGGMNTAEIGRFMKLPEPSVEKVIHTRICRDMAREIRHLRDLRDCIA